MLDLVNAIYAYFLVFVLFLGCRVPVKYFIIISTHLFLVFLTNGVLFSAEYMPDQFRYLHAASSIRESGFDLSSYQNYDMNNSANVSHASLFFSIFPIPFLHSVYSISIINFILYSVAFIYLYNKKILTNFNIWFYLLCPSLALYSAIGSRDILIFFIMIMSCYQLYRGNSIISVIVAAPLIFIKLQNFILYLLPFSLYFILKKYKNKKNIQFFILSILMVFLSITLLPLVSVDDINNIRFKFFIEDRGLPAEYNPINSWIDIFRYGLVGIFYTLLLPLPWNVNGPLQLLQSFENIIIIMIISFIIKNLIKLNNDFKYFLFGYILVHSAAYGLIVSNYGTLSRYKFSFVLIFILFSVKIIHDEKLKKARLEKSSC